MVDFIRVVRTFKGLSPPNDPDRAPRANGVYLPTVAHSRRCLV